MASYSYNVMQDLYALGELYAETGNFYAKMEAGTYADYADNVSKQLNDGTPRTAEEYKAEFSKRMKNRLTGAMENNDIPELTEFHEAVSEYLETLTS